MQKELLSRVNVEGIGEEISHELAGELISAYSEANAGEATTYMVGRQIIEQILAQPGCAGLRFYNALNEKGQKTLVYVGVDAEGKDILKKTVVEKDGSLATQKGIVADRIFDIPWLTTIFK